MGDVVPIRAGLFPVSDDFRQKEAEDLRKCIEERRVNFRPKESAVVAGRLDSRIGRFAKTSSQDVAAVCRDIWPNEDNPAKRRFELKRVKTPKKLMAYAEKIASAINENFDDVLLEAFRGTIFEENVSRILARRDISTEIEECYERLAETLQKLAFEVARVERLREHQRRLKELRWRYDLATRTIVAAGGPILKGPLANRSVFYEEYPPLPSVVLFREPKSIPVVCSLILGATGRTRQVTVTVFREVRIAIGPADEVDEPSALFEFRSVLDLRSSKKELRVLYPWHDLEDAPVVVEIDGAWHHAKLVLPKEPITDPHFVEQFSNWPVQRFPARLEPPLQFEHHDIVWRPVTADTCSDLLNRDANADDVEWRLPIAEALAECPPGSLGQRLELALFSNTPDSLPVCLRREARMILELGQSWIDERLVMVEDAHQKLRGSWETWS